MARRGKRRAPHHIVASRATAPGWDYRAMYARQFWYWGADPWCASGWRGTPWRAPMCRANGAPEGAPTGCTSRARRLHHAE